MQMKLNVETFRSTIKNVITGPAIEKPEITINYGNERQLVSLPRPVCAIFRINRRQNH